MTATLSNGSALCIAGDYIDRGWAPIPIPPKTKAPKIDGWEQLRIGKIEVPGYFIPTNNIGVLNGAPSQWLIDVDLDHDLARSLADKYLPPTLAEFGREGARRSHWLYVVTDEVETHQRRLPKVNGKAPMIVELRSTGSQTVFPGSVHPEGMRVEWDSPGEPAKVPPGLLLAAVDALANAVEKELGIERKEITRRAATNGTANHIGTLPPNVIDRARKYLAKVPPAISGCGGHDQTFSAACVLVLGFALDRGPALALLQEWNQTCQPPWDDWELEHKIDDALKQPGERGYLLADSNLPMRAMRCTLGRDGSEAVIANFTVSEVEDKDGESKSVNVPMSMTEIIDTIGRQRDGWPRRVDNMLFVDGEHGVDYFDRRTTAGFFGWLRRHHKVEWNKGGSFVSQAEPFAEIERTTKRYDAIELLPHEPPIGGIYYRGTAPAAGDGRHLRELVDRFRPDTTVDRDLIQAAFVTPFWGGLPGSRPAFVITSDDGRGVGKTKVAETISHLCGGHVDVSAGEDIETLKTRALAPVARTKRIAICDNIKSMRLSWAELEALITSPVISGRQLYVGEGQRPNILTWFLTLNGVSMATDMAQRSVIIKIVRGANAGPWWEETRKFVDDHRDKIIGDIIGALRSEPYPLSGFSRWATWEKDVLCRLPEPGDAQRLILERQGEADCELDEAEIIEEHFAEQLLRLGYAPQTAQVRIQVATAARWYSWAVGEPTKTAAVTRKLKQMADEGHLKRLAPEPGRSHGRCFIWTGPAADIFQGHIANDLQARIGQAMADG